MPNWCSNRVEISVSISEGSEQQLRAVHSIFDSPNPFNAILPQPDWANTPGPTGVLPTRVTRSYKRADGTEHEESILMFGNKQDDRWYAWRVNHWGTKWDLGDRPDWIDNYEESDFLLLSFDTAWAPPTGICKALREQYPALIFRWFYDEPDTESAGYL